MPSPYIYATLYLPLKPSMHWHFILTITLQERLHRPLSQMRKQTSSNKCEVKTNESLCHSLLRTLLNWSILLTYLTTKVSVPENVGSSVLTCPPPSNTLRVFLALPFPPTLLSLARYPHPNSYYKTQYSFTSEV